MRYHLDEFVHVENNVSSQPSMVQQEKTLWELGNRVASYARDVLFMYPKMQAGINATRAWQYVFRNGAGMLRRVFTLTSYCCITITYFSRTCNVHNH
jgi:hypothetical protein